MKKSAIGFSLLEVLVSLSLVSIFVGSIWSVITLVKKLSNPKENEQCIQKIEQALLEKDFFRTFANKKFFKNAFDKNLSEVPNSHNLQGPTFVMERISYLPVKISKFALYKLKRNEKTLYVGWRYSLPSVNKHLLSNNTENFLNGLGICTNVKNVSFKPVIYDEFKVAGLFPYTTKKWNESNQMGFNHEILKTLYNAYSANYEKGKISRVYIALEKQAN